MQKTISLLKQAEKYFGMNRNAIIKKFDFEPTSFQLQSLLAHEIEVLIELEGKAVIGHERFDWLFSLSGPMTSNLHLKDAERLRSFFEENWWKWGEIYDETTGILTGYFVTGIKEEG